METYLTIPMPGPVRPGWDEYFVQIAKDVASRSTCLNRKVGAVIVDRYHRQISTGYNGPPPGMKHCSELGGCLRRMREIPSGQSLELCRAVHAETNAILFAPDRRQLRGATIYLSTTPCSNCAKNIITVEISQIVYFEDIYPDQLALDMLNEAGIRIRRF